MEFDLTSRNSTATKKTKEALLESKMSGVRTNPQREKKKLY